MIERQTEFFINGRWTPAAGPEDRELIDPSSEEVIGYVRDAIPVDMDRAVAAARLGDESLGRCLPFLIFPYRKDCAQRCMPAGAEGVPPDAPPVPVDPGTPTEE